MDVLQRFLDQLSALRQVWMPFLVGLSVVCFVIWRIIEWRYRGIIEGVEARLKLREDMVQFLETQRPRPPSVSEHQSPEQELVSDPPVANIESEKIGDEKRVYVPDGVDASYLRNLYRENTTVQAEKLTAPYLGKWMRAEGEVTNVSSGNGRLTVSTKDICVDPNSVDSLRGMYITFRSDLDRIEMLRRGDRICAEGRIDRISSFDVELDPAELVTQKQK